MTAAELTEAVAPDVHVELRGISKRFGGAQALAGIDLRIERGAIHGLVGENGAGKSTLGKIIAGVQRPDEGELRVDGRSVAYGSPRAALADGVTMIAQEPTLVPTRSVLNNVFLGIEAGRGGLLHKRDLRDRFAELSRTVGFELRPNVLARTLRVADQQKVEILRAVARTARLIIMDEPTAALTADESERLFKIVRRLRDSGTTIVFISHLLSEVLALVDVVTVLRDGRKVCTSPASNETPDRLVTAMLGRSLDLTFPSKQYPPQESQVVLSVQGLSRPPFIDDVSFTIRAGEIVGLAGLIGSGRSEVARAIFGADAAATGEIRIDGKQVSIRSPRDAVGAGIALLPENRKQQGLLLERSIQDNMTLPHLRTLSRGGFIQRRAVRLSALALMKRVDVRSTGPHSKVSALSGGNQQKVLFAKWLFRRPRVLLADEPTRGVDVGAKRAIYELVQSVAAEGTAVLLISSEHEEVLGLAHRVIVMRQGRIVARLDRETMDEDAVLHAAFATTASAEDSSGT